MSSMEIDVKSAVAEIESTTDRLERGGTLLSGNARHFKKVPLLDAKAIRA